MAVFRSRRARCWPELPALIPDACPGIYAQSPDSLPAFVVSAAEDSHCSAVTAVACCGDYVCSGGGDAAIRVWKATTLELVKCVPRPKP